MTLDRAQHPPGRETNRRPPDNLDLDSRAALALGYGVHYGRYKTDHPHTRAEREARGEVDEKKRPPRRSYTYVCPVCGGTFTTPTKSRKYCSQVCKTRKEYTQQKEAERKKMEA